MIKYQYKRKDYLMFDDYIEILLESIEDYNKKFHAPYYILLYLPANEEYDRPDEMYFAVLASMVKPNEEMISEIFFETRKQLGNIIYAADYVVKTYDEAVNYLESLID